MAFIVDIRRGNLDLQLMYKALFELSADRAEFVSRLFSKTRPAGLDAQVDGVAKSSRVLERRDRARRCTENLQAIDDLLLTQTRASRCRTDDLQGIEYVYHAFYQFGPAIQYSSTAASAARFQPSYADLMTATDAAALAAQLPGHRGEFPRS